MANWLDEKLKDPEFKKAFDEEMEQMKKDNAVCSIRCTEYLELEAALARLRRVEAAAKAMEKWAGHNRSLSLTLRSLDDELRAALSGQGKEG